MCAAATNRKATSNRSTQEPQDGDDTINWIARQPWSNGKVGMIGGSYLGIAQWKAALLNNPHLKAIFPVVSGDDEYRDRFYSTGGAIKLGHRLEWLAENLKAPGYEPDFNKFIWHLPLRTADVAATGQTVPSYRQAMAHPDLRLLLARHQHQRAPGSNPHSGLCHGRMVRQLRGKRFGCVCGPAQEFRRESHSDRSVAPQHVLPVSRRRTSDRQSSVPVRRLQLQWFDQWLMGKDTPLVSTPPVQVFVMGANEWREEREWPPAKAKVQTVVSGQRRPCQYSRGRRAIAAATRAGGRGRCLHLRSRRSGSDARRRGLLQSQGVPLGAAGPAPGGDARGRARLYHAASEQ